MTRIAAQHVDDLLQEEYRKNVEVLFHTRSREMCVLIENGYSYVCGASRDPIKKKHHPVFCLKTARACDDNENNTNFCLLAFCLFGVGCSGWFVVAV